MALFKYTTIEILKKILAGSIRFTQPGALNDPFELAMEFDVSEHRHDGNASITFSLLAPRREPSVGRLPVDFESEHCNDTFARGVRAGLDENIGILCLSRNGASLPMWAHYAASYSGALIEFKEAHEFFSGAIDVEYCTHRPKLKLGSYNERVNGPVPIAELCVKSKEWEYEREVRIIRSLTDCRMVSRRRHDAAYPIYVQELPPDGIASVVLGERTSTDDQREIVSLLAGGDIRLYLDAVSNWDYDLRREPILLGPGLGPLISPRTAPIFSHLDSTHGEIARWQLKNSRFAHMPKDPL